MDVKTLPSLQSFARVLTDNASLKGEMNRLSAEEGRVKGAATSFTFLSGAWGLLGKASLHDEGSRRLEFGILADREGNTKTWSPSLSQYETWKARPH